MMTPLPLSGRTPINTRPAMRRSSRPVFTLLPLLLLLLVSNSARGDKEGGLHDNNNNSDDDEEHHSSSSTTAHSRSPLRPTSRIQVRRSAPPSPVLLETSSAIESIWALQITDESRTPGTGGSSKLYGGVSEHTGSSLATTLWSQHMWDLHKSRKRYWRALVNFPTGTIFRGLAPVLSVIAAWTSVSYWQKWKVTGAALSYLASPLGLMLAFRVNSVVSRFHEGRSQWGQVRFVPIDPTFPSEDDASTARSPARPDDFQRPQYCQPYIGERDRRRGRPS